jgi:hypothetical protein
MVDEFATVGGGQSRPHLLEKPLIIVHEALHGLLHKGRRIATTLGGKPGKPSLQVGTKINIHVSRVRAELRRVKRGLAISHFDDHVPKASRI